MSREFSAPMRAAFHRIRENPEVEDILAQLNAGDEVTLVREPDNPYDPNAIQVHFLNTNIGFVGKEFAAQMANDLDNEEEHTATVDFFNSPLIPQLTIIFPNLEEL